MSFTSYPSAADIEVLLKSSSYWPTDSTKAEFARRQADIGARAAADEWERLVGWQPFFITSTQPTVRRFREIDSRGFLSFEGAAQSIASVTIGETEIVEDDFTGYIIEPENAASRGVGITGIHLGYRQSLIAQGRYPVAVNAVWGRVSSIPGDVWQAVQQKAALIALTQIENLQSVASISQDGFTKAYDVVGIVTQKDLVTIWGKDFTVLAERWKRVVC